MPKKLTALEIMTRLVAFPTVSRDSNLALVDWVEDYLDGYGVTATRDYDASGKKASIYATIGPDVAGGIVMSGHTDVVPVDGQTWDTDPWTVTEKDGKYFGRGTCDMKGFDAIALAAVPLALERGIKRPLQIALTRDEEIGCIGAPPMIAKMAPQLPQAAAVIVGEPSMMKCVTGHKGGVGFQVHVQGFEVHSSLMHTGVNAIMFGARLIDWANKMNARNAAATPSELASVFNPPWTTLHVGTVAGGTAHNITAKDCRFGVDFRFVPGEDIEGWKAAFLEQVALVEADMKAIRPEAAIHVEERFMVPALTPEMDGMAERLTRAITGDNARHVVSYGTEAGQFQQGGYSTVVCGPGDIAQAHQPNEFITIAQFQAGQAFAERILGMLAE